MLRLRSVEFYSAMKKSAKLQPKSNCQVFTRKIWKTSKKASCISNKVKEPILPRTCYQSAQRTPVPSIRPIAKPPQGATKPSIVASTRTRSRRCRSSRTIPKQLAIRPWSRVMWQATDSSNYRSLLMSNECGYKKIRLHSSSHLRKLVKRYASCSSLTQMATPSR